jgi:hypothetical protein
VEKHQIPNTKSQLNSNSQIQNSKQPCLGRLSIEVWDLFGICSLEFGIFRFRLWIGECIQKGIDLLKRIRQEKNPDAYQEKTAHDIDDPHVSSYFIKSRKKGIESERGKKKWNSQAYRIVR